MKLINIKFTQHKSNKVYTFRVSPYLRIKENDILFCLDYPDSTMQILKIFYYPNYTQYNNRELKELSAKNCIVVKDSVNQKEKTRTLGMTRKQARDCYLNGSKELKKIALMLYTEEELEKDITTEDITIAEIYKDLSIDKICTSVDICGKSEYTKITSKIDAEIRIHAILRVIADYLNGEWEPENIGKKYCLAKTDTDIVEPDLCLGKDYYVEEHSNYKTTGVVYFKTMEYVKMAYHMIKGLL